ncbi:hypothetical protein ACIPVK_10635, partial [Paeniglutamicibacter sp. MACA_103]|uniref:hypothetical protein n=1 Tax=Paeniglutamicibacter sp. MACA_103 TaxID=3377337 RepID=UPI00389581B7
FLLSPAIEVQRRAKGAGTRWATNAFRPGHAFPTSSPVPPCHRRTFGCPRRPWEVQRCGTLVHQKRLRRSLESVVEAAMESFFWHQGPARTVHVRELCAPSQINFRQNPPETQPRIAKGDRKTPWFRGSLRAATAPGADFISTALSGYDYLRRKDGLRMGR